MATKRRLGAAGTAVAVSAALIAARVWGNSGKSGGGGSGSGGNGTAQATISIGVSNNAAMAATSVDKLPGEFVAVDINGEASANVPPFGAAPWDFYTHTKLLDGGSLVAERQGQVFRHNPGSYSVQDVFTVPDRPGRNLSVEVRIFGADPKEIISDPIGGKTAIVPSTTDFSVLATATLAGAVRIQAPPLDQEFFVGDGFVFFGAGGGPGNASCLYIVRVIEGTDPVYRYASTPGGAEIGGVTQSFINSYRTNGGTVQNC